MDTAPTITRQERVYKIYALALALALAPALAPALALAPIYHPQMI